VSVLTVDTYEPDQSGETTLWIVAAIVVVALHMALAVAYLRLRPEPEVRAEAPVIDVAFMPATNAPAAPPSIDQPEPAPTKMDLPKDDALPPPVPELEPPPQVEAMVPHEEPPPVPEQAVVVPQEKPPEIKPVPEKPAVAPAQPPKVVHREKVENKREPPPKSAALPGTKPMRVASAPNAAAESEGAKEGRASWLSEFIAHMRSIKTSVNGTKESGTVVVSATIDRNGRLVSRRIASSSGSPVLDREALELIEHAQPFPRFPASMPQAQLVQNIPLHLRPQ